MPNVKIIDKSEIKLDKVAQKKYQDVIEFKRCLWISLALDRAFIMNNQEVIQNCFKFKVDMNTRTISGPTGNSWKSLVMALISLTYLQYGNDIIGKFWDGISTLKQHRENCNMRLGNRYEMMIDEKRRSKIEMEVVGQNEMMSPEEAFRRILAPKEERLMLDNQMRAKRLQLLEQAYAALPKDDRIEEVFAPPGLRPLYVIGEYEPENIAAYIVLFSKLSGVDLEQSTVTTEFAEKTPQQYKSSPATPRHSGLLLGDSYQLCNH